MVTYLLVQISLVFSIVPDIFFWYSRLDCIQLLFNRHQISNHLGMPLIL